MRPYLASLAVAGFSGHGGRSELHRVQGLERSWPFSADLGRHTEAGRQFQAVPDRAVRLIFLDSYLKPFDGFDFGHSFDFGYIWACPAFGGQRPDGFGYGGCNRQLLISLFHCQPLRAATSGCSEAERLAQRVDDAA